MVDRIFDLASGDSDRIASKQLAGEFRSMPPAFLAGMYVTEPFNPNRVASQVSNLLQICESNTTADVRLFCLLKSINLIGTLDAHDHEYLVNDVGPALVALGKVLQSRNGIALEF